MRKEVTFYDLIYIATYIYVVTLINIIRIG